VARELAGFLSQQKIPRVTDLVGTLRMP